MNLAASFGMPPGALGEIRTMMAEMMQATPAEIQSEINDARNGGAPPEFVAILSQILASKTGAPGFPMNTLTDNAGRFTFSNVRSGNYLITVERDGFFGISAKGTNARSKTISKPVTVAEGQSPPEVSVVMTPGARIQGRLLDTDGKPLSNMNVEAFSLAYQNGTPMLQSAAKQTTDDRGEFRLFWLEPGNYFVAARTPRSPRSMGSAIGPRDVPVLTFYPSNAGYADSIRVPVKAGQEVVGIEVKMRVAPAVTVSGQIAGLPASTAGGTVAPRLMLIDRNYPISDEDNLIYGLNANIIANGIFGIFGVPAGSYEIVVRVPRRAGVTNAELWGRVPLEVRDRDIEGLTVAVQAGVEVRGKVTILGTAASSLKDPIVVGLQPDGIFDQTDMEGGEPAPIAADGSFSYSSIPSADYKVRVLGIPSNAYVVDIRQAGTSIYASGLHVSDKAPQPIEVTVGLDGGTVEGVTYTPDQKVSSSTTVVLIPTLAAERLNSERHKVVTSDAQGRFKITGIAPGLYKAFAWQTLPLGAYQNATFVGQFEAQGAVVDVKPSATNNMRVAVIQN
jgi:hypothetical protein